MFSLRTKLLLFLALIIMVVIVAWLYAQQTYSAFNLTEPGDSGNPNPQNLGTGTVPITLSPTPIQTSTLAPSIIDAALDDIGCTLPLDYWLQNQTKIPPQILVNVSTANQAEVCVNYAQSEICTTLGEVSSAPGVILRQQFLVAIMNYLSGADPGAIGNTINDAYEWLRSHSSTESITEEDLQAARLYAETLQSYNQGDIGPGACEVEVILVVQDDTTTPSPQTSGATATIFPTTISTPTARRTVVIIVPTSTEVPNQGPEPTLTSQPPPADTEPAPTETAPPQPTDTQIPPVPPTDPPTPTSVPEDATPTPVP